MEISILGFILLSENSILSFSTFPSGCPTWRSEWPFQQVQHCYLLLFIVIICYHDIYHYQPILMWYDPKATTINPRISISTSFPVSPAHRFPGMEPQQAADVSSPPRLTPSPEAEDPKTLSIKWPDQVKCTEKRRICWVGPLYTCPCPYESWGHIFRFLKMSIIVHKHLQGRQSEIKCGVSRHRGVYNIHT